jgi:hypothetical protein
VSVGTWCMVSSVRSALECTRRRSLTNPHQSASDHRPISRSRRAAQHEQGRHSRAVRGRPRDSMSGPGPDAKQIHGRK